ncbi:MAG: cyanoexosortase A [Acaryochloris sp. RU_4_1]|nr:cyanoexosortase A [Acaryochloris sp. RU_4_1]NJR53795.1 cyanoexosortase A [Acaryochloris sp. CRU_2_0]
MPPSFILGLGGLFLAVFFTLNIRADQYAHLAMSLVFWCAALSSLWDKKSELRLGSDAISIGIGASILVGILFQSLRSPAGWFLGFAPFVAAIALMLLASGFQGLGQYQTEALMLFCLGIPKILLKFLPDISPLTAQFSTYLLWYIGFPVELYNNQIRLPGGSVNVVPSCSGLNLITYMLAITFIFLLMFPLKPINAFFTPIIAVFIGFFINSIRVATLALLSTQGNTTLFKYWHSNEGALLFVLLAVLLFGLFCGWMVRKTELPSPK